MLHSHLQGLQEVSHITRNHILSRRALATSSKINSDRYHSFYLPLNEKKVFLWIILQLQVIKV